MKSPRRPELLVNDGLRYCGFGQIRGCIMAICRLLQRGVYGDDARYVLAVLSTCCSCFRDF